MMSRVCCTQASGHNTNTASNEFDAQNFSMVCTITGFDPSIRYCLGFSGFPIRVPEPPANTAANTFCLSDMASS